MIDSLYIAATGMNAQQAHVDSIANNLANVNTTGFKRNRVNFEDLMYREVARTNELLGAAPNAFRTGAGVAVSGTGKIFASGEFKKTEQPLDVAIRGNGFLEVLQADGTRAYTRAGALQLNRDRMLVTAEGLVVNPQIQVPADTTQITIENGGRVLVAVPDESAPVEIGQIELASFTNPSALRPLGDNLYVPTDLSGDPNPGRPGEDGLGVLQQGFLESSNVKLVDEFVNLVVAQRAYEVSAKAIQASDEMLGIANNLRR